ncbi:MAG: PEP-CTERM sorting domain-containing protein [Armatimonadetes bacterium]|nr:PEP-CTERM sorting domain-containing protein [Armatimonadota bacterium]
MRVNRLSTLAAVLCALSVQAAAAVYTYANWSSQPDGGHVDGTIAGIGVHYTGEVYFANLNNTGVYYWTQYSPPPYTSATVSNGPGTTDIIGQSVSGVNRIDFDSPVMNPIMAICSMGQPGLPVTYSFNQSFTILSYGSGYWGSGTLTDLGGNVLEGREGHGTIQFSGAVSSIIWEVSPDEGWHGITVGIVPEPTSLVTLSLGGLALLRRRRS